MEDVDGQVMETLVIMFTVVIVGIVVIVGSFRVPIYPPLLSALAALWAWGLIAVKRLYFWGQRKGRDQMFSLMGIHVYEISSSVMLLLLMLFYMGHNQQGLVPPTDSVLLFLVGLSITGYGMGTFFSGGPTVMSVVFPGDLGVCLIALGLSVVIAGYRSAHPQGHFRIRDPLIVYTLVLLVATYIAGL